MKRCRSQLAAIIVATACAAFASTASAEIIYECAASGPTGQTSGSGVLADADFFLGVNFEVTTPVIVRSIGGHFLKFTDGPIFGAIVALTGQYDVPDAPDLSSDDVLGVTLFETPSPSDNVAGNLPLILKPGWYAVMFGSGRFGATGEAGAMGNNIPDGTSLPYTIRQSDGKRTYQASPVRLFVDSEPVTTLDVVVDTNTQMPGETVNFTSFSVPAIADGIVAFRGTNTPQNKQGVYTHDGGALAVIADRHTTIPGTGTLFESFGSYVGIDNGDVVFDGSGPSGANEHSGLYCTIGGTLHAVAIEDETLFPGSADTLATVSSYPTIDNGQIAFYGGTSGGVRQGVFRYEPGVGLTTIATLDSTVPGTTRKFEGLIIARYGLDHGRVTFLGYAASAEPDFSYGIYAGSGGEIEMLYDRTTLIPGTSLPFGFFGYQSLRGGRVAFGGADNLATPTEYGIYNDAGGTLHTIVTLATPTPDGTGTFKNMYEPSFNGQSIAFCGVHQDNKRGIYTDYGGTLQRVAAPGDVVGSRTVSNVFMLWGAMDANQIAFSIAFTDGSSGIAVATLGEVFTPDYDKDGDCDLGDFTHFLTCFNGPARVATRADCVDADSDLDTDVDLADFTVFLSCFNGPNRPPACS